MSKIVCATKAAQNSRAVHEAAFRLAEETGLDLEFLHVIAVPNFDDLMEPLQEAVRSELHWLVHSLTRISRQRTGHNSIKPKVSIVTGPVAEAILKHIESEDVEVLMIASTADEEDSVFEKAGFESFLVEANQANVRVEVIDA